MAEEPIPNCRIPFLVSTKDFLAQKPIVLAKMLIQGPLGLDLQIYKKPNHPRLFFLMFMVVVRYYSISIYASYTPRNGILCPKTPYNSIMSMQNADYRALKF